MNFNNHSHLEGLHAFLSPSNYHWINYDEEKLILRYNKYQATQKGLEFHELAKRLINLGVKLPRTNKTLNMYVNDAIGFKMNTEQILYYSDNCFGTADTLNFRKNFLRIHDLKTGEIPCSMNQLLVYTALFCLEYKQKPHNMDIELRIYQFDEIEINHPSPDDISMIMEKIISFDKKIEQIKLGG